MRYAFSNTVLHWICLNKWKQGLEDNRLKKQIYFEFSILGNNFDESKEKYPLIVLHERFPGAVTLVRSVEALGQFYPADGVCFLVVHRHDDLVHEYGVGLCYKFVHTLLGLARNEGKKQTLFEFENDWNKAMLLLDYWKLSIQNSDISIFQYFINLLFDQFSFFSCDF